MAGPRCVDDDFPTESCRVERLADDLRRAVLGVGCSVYRNVADAVTIPFFPLALVLVLMVSGGPVRLVDITFFIAFSSEGERRRKKGSHSNELVATVSGGLQLGWQSQSASCRKGHGGWQLSAPTIMCLCNSVKTRWEPQHSQRCEHDAMPSSAGPKVMEEQEDRKL